MNIDWSKAPEDATHAREHQYGLDFYKRNGDGKWVYWDARGQWAWAYATSEIDCCERPKPWTGEGLPTVGIKCEVKNDVTDGWDLVDEVLVHTTVNGETAVVFKRGEKILYALAKSFRPIRTAEQIAAEEEKSIRLWLIDEHQKGGLHGIAKALHSEGYRKQEQK